MDLYNIGVDSTQGMTPKAYRNYLRISPRYR
jgi:hypothetical protein